MFIPKIQVGRKVCLKTRMAEDLRRKKAEASRVKKLIKSRGKRSRKQHKKINNYITRLESFIEALERPYISFEEASVLIKDISESMKSLGVEDFHISGAYRRKLPKIQSIIIVIPTQTGKLSLDTSSFIVEMANRNFVTHEITRRGRSEASYLFRIEGIVVSFFVASADNLGTYMLYTTGNQAFLRLLIAHARSLGYQFYRKGLFCGGTIVSSHSEQAVLDELGVTFLPPENRAFGKIKVLPLK